MLQLHPWECGRRNRYRTDTDTDVLQLHPWMRWNHLISVSFRENSLVKGLIGNCKDGELRIYTINSKHTSKQEYTRVGCVPSAVVVVSGGVCLEAGVCPGCLPRGWLPRGCLPRGCLPRWCLPRGCLPRGCLPRRCLPRHPPVNRINWRTGVKTLPFRNYCCGR